MYYKPHKRTRYIMHDRRFRRIRSSPPVLKPCRDINKEETIDIGITGVKYILDKKLNAWKRSCWFIAIVICSGACVCQLMDRISHYFNVPITTTVEVQRDHKIPMPSLTICPTISTTIGFLNLIAMDILERENGVIENCPECGTIISLPPSMEMNKVWNLYELNGSAIHVSGYSPYVKNFLDEDTIPFNVTHEIIEVPAGKCVTIHHVVSRRRAPTGFTLIHDFNLYNIFPVLHTLSPCTKKCYSVYNFTFDFSFHDPKMPQNHLAAFYDNTVHAGQQSTYFITIREFVSINTKKKPCAQDTIKLMTRIADCTEKRMAENIPCRIPFIDGPATLKHCNSPKDLKEAFRAAVRTYIENGTDIIQKCNDLHQPCNQLFFNTIHKFSSRAEDASFVEIKVDVHKIFESIREENAYTVTALTSDIGGSLGFLLGVCVLHFVEIFHYLFTRLTEGIKKVCA